MTDLKILYLDIDGVLMPGELIHSPHYNNDFRSLDMGRVELLRGLQKIIPYKIVLSSTWRKHPWEPANLLQKWPDISLYGDETEFVRASYGIVGCFSCTPAHLTGNRGEEIEDHRIALCKHLGYEFDYAILDDDSDMLLSQLPYFVKTKFQTGLKPEHIEELYQVLSKGIEHGR